MLPGWQTSWVHHPEMLCHSLILTVLCYMSFLTYQDKTTYSYKMKQNWKCARHVFLLYSVYHFPQALWIVTELKNIFTPNSLMFIQVSWSKTTVFFLLQNITSVMKTTLLLETYLFWCSKYIWTIMLLFFFTLVD